MIDKKRIQVSPDEYTKVRPILRDMGLSVPQAISLFLNHVIETRSLGFAIDQPKALNEYDQFINDLVELASPLQSDDEVLEKYPAIFKVASKISQTERLYNTYDFVVTHHIDFLLDRITSGRGLSKADYIRRNVKTVLLVLFLENKVDLKIEDPKTVETLLRYVLRQLSISDLPMVDVYRTASGLIAKTKEKNGATTLTYQMLEEKMLTPFFKARGLSYLENMVHDVERLLVEIHGTFGPVMLKIPVWQSKIINEYQELKNQADQATLAKLDPVTDVKSTLGRKLDRFVHRLLLPIKKTDRETHTMFRCLMFCHLIDQNDVFDMLLKAEPHNADNVEKIQQFLNKHCKSQFTEEQILVALRISRVVRCYINE